MMMMIRQSFCIVATETDCEIAILPIPSLVYRSRKERIKNYLCELMVKE